MCSVWRGSLTGKLSQTCTGKDKVSSGLIHLATERPGLYVLSPQRRRQPLHERQVIALQILHLAAHA
jgi:hypothetical protein